MLTQRCLREHRRAVVINGIGSLTQAQFEALVDNLVAGDLALFAEIRSEVSDVPAEVSVGDLFISCEPQATNWYEVMGLPQPDLAFVRLFSATFKRGDYDYVDPARFTACVTAKLFERARANGFRGLRRLS